MPLNNAVANATDFFERHLLVGEVNYEVFVPLGFALSLSVSVKGGVLTLKIVDDSENSLFPMGLLMKVMYIFVREDGGFIRPFQECLVLNTYDVQKFSSLNLSGVELTYTQLALVSEVLALIFEKLRSLNPQGDTYVYG